MGWWSCDLFGGDGPLDVLAACESHLFPSPTTPLATPDRWTAAERMRVRTALDGLGGVEALIDVFEPEHPSAVPLVVALAMGCGAPVSAHVRSHAARALAADEWAAEDPQRRAVLDAFQKQLDHYDNHTPVALPNTGLLEQMQIVVSRARPR